MTIKKTIKPDSYKAPNGKWVPSGLELRKDAISIIEIKHEFNKNSKATKKEADEFFITKIKKK